MKFLDAEASGASASIRLAKCTLATANKISRMRVRNALKIIRRSNCSFEQNVEFPPRSKTCNENACNERRRRSEREDKI